MLATLPLESDPQHRFSKPKLFFSIIIIMGGIR